MVGTYKGADDFLSKSMIADFLLQSNFQLVLPYQMEQDAGLWNSVWVKWQKAGVQQQAYSNDLEKSDLFFSGMFCTIESTMMDMTGWDEPQTMFTLVSRLESLTSASDYLLKGWNLTTLATVWALLNVVQCGGCYLFKVIQAVEKQIFTLLLFIRSVRSIMIPWPAEF